MSKSRRKTPIISCTTCKSEKKDKRIYNRAIRRITKNQISQGLYEYLIRHPREYVNLWSLGKDGKYTFDPVKWAKFMRK